MKLLHHIAVRVGGPGLITWLLLVSVYLRVRVPNGTWLWSDLAKYTAMVLVISYIIGSAKLEPHVLCTSCGRKNSDPKVADLTGWRCGNCNKKTLVRVEKPS
jgi:DNA-directed RNA polymerase subunit RPC12/RpoP